LRFIASSLALRSAKIRFFFSSKAFALTSLGLRFDSFFCSVSLVSFSLVESIDFGSFSASFLIDDD